MVTKETMGKILALLQGKYESHGRKFGAAVSDLYERALENLDEDAVRIAASRVILTSPKLPEVSDLLLSVASHVSPTPDEDFAWAEVLRQVRYQRQRWSHPLIERTVLDMGGADNLDHLLRYTDTPQTVIRAQFLDSYRRKRQIWNQKVVDQLSLGPLFRDERYFPVEPGTEFDPLALPLVTVQKALPAGDADRKKREAVPIPDEFKQKMIALGFTKIGSKF
jgi:hypothetical protein